mgnify:CR=1 FL=1|tara:strand:- start:10060 stop:11949 length:1890 start_codon:yes stop_codon:yes gene_type:complete
MPRLPIPGKDSGTWGTILNDYLSQSHNTDGTLKADSVGSVQLADNAVTNSAIAPNTITATEIQDESILEAQLASGVQTKLNAVAPTWSTISGKPAVIAAGSDASAARSVIGAVNNDTFNAGTLIATEYGVTTDLSNIASALQTLLNTAASAGKRVYLPKGTYNLGSAVAIPAGTHLYGDGMVNGTKIKLIDSFPTQAPFYNAVTSGFSNVYIHDLEIDGNAVGQSGDQTINGNPNVLMFLSSASGTPGSNVIVERVYAHDSFRLGIAFQHIDGGAVRDCVVGPNGRDGVTIYGCKRIQVRNNRINQCGDDMIGINSETRLCENIVVEGNILTGPSSRNVGKGIRLFGGRNITVFGNTIDSPCEIGIYCATYESFGMSRVTIIGNIITNTGTNGSSAKQGILVQANRAEYHTTNYAYITDVIISDNVINSTLGAGIELRSDHTGVDELARIKVRGNNISSCTGEGIKVTYTTSCPVYDTQIVDNTCHNCTGHGIWAVSAKRIKISGNVCYDNGSGGVNTYGIRAESCDIITMVDNLAYETRSGASRTQTVGVQCTSPLNSAVQVGNNTGYNHASGQVSYNSIPGASTLEGWHGKVSGQLAATGSRGGNAALASLLTQLAAKGVIIDNTSA